MNLKEFGVDYIKRLKNILDNLDYDVIERIIDRFEQTVHKKSRIFILGNGGSAATASHMVNDLGVGLRRREIINFDITSLADNTPSSTAISNDIGYENIFFMQIKGLLKADDVVVAISCSGNSANIIKVTDYAKEIGSTIIGITGFDGGKLKQDSDINFHISADNGEYGLVEDAHMILDHLIYSYYIQKQES